MTTKKQWAPGEGFARPKPASTPKASTATNTTAAANLHYRLDNQEWLSLCEELKFAEVKVLLHLRTLNPFGDRVLEIGIRELGRTLKMDHSTVSRALKVLEKKGYIDMELVQVNVRVKAKPVPPDSGGGSTHHQGSTATTEDLQPPPPDEPAEPETPPESEPAAFSTDPAFVPEQTLKDSVNRTGLKTGGINSEVTGTLLKRLIEEAGIPLNAALLSVLEKLEKTHPEDAYNRVKNAVSAYVEQKVTVRNPQGFLSAALRRGFTSNSAKRESRNRTAQLERTNLPPASPASPASPVLPTVPTVPQRYKVIDLSGLIADIQINCQRLGLTMKEAIERFGRAGRSLHDLSDLDLATFRRELAGWT